MAEAGRKIKLMRIIKKYDTNQTGQLEKEQVTNLLTDMDTVTQAGTAPDAEELDFVMKFADKAGNNAISLEELQEALDCWMTYVQRRSFFEDKLKKYDASQSGNLTRDECRAYLTDLNEDKALTDEEFDSVFREADVMGNGVINKMELQRVTILWYGYVEEQAAANASCACSIQ